MFLESLNDFKNLCPNKPVECATASRVYMDLILDKKYVSINKCYDESLDVFYLKAKTLEQNEVVILPSLVTQQLDLNVIDQLQTHNSNDMRYVLKYFVLPQNHRQLAELKVLFS